MTWVWLIPLLPLLGAVLTAVIGPRFLKQCHWLVIIGVAVAVILSLVLLGDVKTRFAAPESPEETAAAEHAAPEPAAGLPSPIIIPGYDWFNMGTLRSLIQGAVDPLTAVMLITVSIVSLLVVIYSSGYMSGDRGYARFFAFLGLFVFSMLMLVLADNFLMLYIFWEAVGLCSYLLIGFYYQRPSAAAAAKKAFLVNRIGDFGFAVGILLIFLNFDTVNYSEVFAAAPAMAESNPGLITAIALCLFAGACGKSAQLPLYVWLPDAMEGPSPVSALIHAATMVTAGVYMVVRCGAIFCASETALIVVAVVGGLTAFFAATIALAQTDIKRILAYSTISQLGYMFLAAGVGAAGAAIFHLYTHAFFKALLFLAAGSIMHAMHDHIDLKKLGGLRKDIPWTYYTFGIGALALAGFPGLAGFFSKDEILAASLNHPTLGWLGWLAVITAALTAFYTFRCFFLAFHGPRITPSEVEHAHETPIMNYVLVALSLGAVFAGYFIFLGFEHFLDRSASVNNYVQLVAATVHEHPYSHTAVTIISILVVAGGIGLAAWLYYAGREKAEQYAQGMLQPVRKVLANKWYVDELYDYIFVRPLRSFGHVCFGNDNWIIDSLLWLITAVPRALGALLRVTQRGLLQGYALLMLGCLVLIFLFVMLALDGSL